MPRYHFDHKGSLIESGATAKHSALSISPFKDATYDKANAAALFKVCFDITVSNKKGTPLVSPPSFESVFELVSTIRKRKVNLGHVFYSDTYKLMVIAFTGTWNELLWAHNFDFPQMEGILLRNYEKGIKVHRGIYLLYQGIQEKIRALIKERRKMLDQLIITGYSLGGSLSNLTAFDAIDTRNPLSVYNYSFAAPAVGNPAFAKKFNALVPCSWRVFNTADITPSLPLPIVWKGVSRNLTWFVRSFIFRKNPHLFRVSKERHDEIYQQVDRNYSFNRNLGQLWRNHETAYLDVLIHGKQSE